MKEIYNISDLFLRNYFLLMACSAIFFIITGSGYIESICLPLVIYVLSLSGSKRSGDFDLLIYFILIWTVVTWIANDFDQKDLLVFRSLMAQTCYILAYFIGRKFRSKYYIVILEKAYWPFIICCFLGIFFYFYPPGWYLNYAVSNSGGNLSGSLFLEYFRLRSIFGHTYYMAYFCAFEGIYIAHRIIIKEDKNIRLKISLVIIILTAILTMMRAPIICFMASTLFLYLYSSYLKKTIIPFFKLIGIFSILILAGVLLYSQLDSEQQLFLEDKIFSVTDNSREMVEKRNDSTRTYSFLGEGVGKHASYVDKISKNTVEADSEYRKIMVEYGYFGLILFLILLVFSFTKCLLNLKDLSLEACYIMMLFVTMIGADPLSTGNKHCLFFYMIIGYVSAYKKRTIHYPKRALSIVKKYRN